MEENGSITKRAALNLDMKNKFLKYFQKFYYYPSIFRDNEELKDKNCIFCVSGKLFSHLYKNKDIKEYKFLLERIHNNCKIFFQMSSIDKSLTIDYFREFENSCICKIGECQSDFDSIMTSNVGINLRSPKNLNTILCHFYTSDSSILSIKKIILEGRISYENSYLLRISSIFCTLIINSYIITCFIRHIDVIIGQLNLLEMGFLILSVTGFTGNPDINIEPEPLIRIKKLFNLHYIIQIAGLLILKLIIIYEAIQFYYTNRLLDPSYVDKIFVTYYFILCIELIFSTSFTINYISFYRKNILSNTFFMFFIILLMAYFIMLITLNSSNIRFDIFNLSYFEFFEYIIDSIDDRNRLKFFVICLCDFIMAFIFSRVTYLIFNQLARKKLSEEKI
jgi:magnesium-transporting ATPase (P-type)